MRMLYCISQRHINEFVCPSHLSLDPTSFKIKVLIKLFQLEFDGLTGTVMFDEEGYRWDYKLDVYTVGLDNGPTKVIIMFDEEGYRWDYKLDVYTVGLEIGPTKVI